MSELGEDTPIQPPIEAVTTTKEAESSTDATAIEEMLDQVNPLE
jgi:hypothetical protein